VRPVEERPRTNPLSGLKVPAEDILHLGKAHPYWRMLKRLSTSLRRIDLLLHLGLRQVRSELDDVLVMSNRIGPVGSETLNPANSKLDFPTMPLELLAVARLFDQRSLAEVLEHGRSVVDGDRIFEFKARHACRGPFDRQIRSVSRDPNSNHAFCRG